MAKTQKNSGQGQIDSFTPEALRQNLRTQFMGRELYFFDTLPTTMDVADAKAREGASEGTAVVADDQTAGRGRFGRSWVAAKAKSIAVSLVLRPGARELPRMHVVTSLAVARAIERVCGLEPRIKWPNDVLINGKKTSGILLTSALDSQGRGYVNAGIGINVNLDAQALAPISPPATSLAVETGCPVSRLEVFCALMEELEALYLSMKQGEDILAIWRPYLETLGRDVQVQWRRENREGFVEKGHAEDVDQDGRLVLRLPNGSRRVLSAGEVTLHL